MEKFNHQGLPVFFLEREKETVVMMLADVPVQVGRLFQVVIPKGFESDGCSMPRLFWRVIGHPFDMRYLKEAIFHDLLYRRQPCDRRTADALFAYVLAGQVRGWRRQAIYWGLRLGGWVAWNKNAGRLAESPAPELAD